MFLSLWNEFGSWLDDRERKRWSWDSNTSWDLLMYSVTTTGYFWTVATCVCSSLKFPFLDVNKRSLSKGTERNKWKHHDELPGASPTSTSSICCLFDATENDSDSEIFMLYGTESKTNPREKRKKNLLRWLPETPGCQDEFHLIYSQTASAWRCLAAHAPSSSSLRNPASLPPSCLTPCFFRLVFFFFFFFLFLFRDEHERRKKKQKKPW